MKRFFFVLLVGSLLLVLGGTALGHFGMVIPSDSMVLQGEKRVLKVTASFSHPMELIGMDLAEPARFGVMVRGKKEDLKDKMKETKLMGRKAWYVDYKVNRPAVYVFFLEPAPYWEPAEDCFIVHYTKTVVPAFGWEDGWDEPLGLKTEIVPLTRPFGLYAGNVFQGIVMLDGRPVPYAEVEIEHYNRDGRAVPPNDYMVAQVIKADGNGVFTYAVPAAGWWGFAALNTSDQKIKHQGEDKDVELGAVIWVEFQEWKEK